MKPPGKTTLTRMLLAAQAAAERIEIAQDDWVRRGMLKWPEPDELARRDDFAGIVRLIEAVQSDAVAFERIRARLAQMRVTERSAATPSEQSEAE